MEINKVNKKLFNWPKVLTEDPLESHLQPCTWSNLQVPIHVT